MEKTKITIHQLKNYLGTGLYCLLDYGDESYFDELVGIHKYGDLMFSDDQGDTHTVDSVKPECYRLSDLNKFIPELGVVPLDEINKIYKAVHYDEDKLEIDGNDICIEIFLPGSGFASEMPQSQTFLWCSNIFEIYQKLFEWHFWPFGENYFEQGLVIDKLKHIKHEN